MFSQTSRIGRADAVARRIGDAVQDRDIELHVTSAGEAEVATVQLSQHERSLLDQVVQELTVAYVGGRLETAMRMGNIIVERIFGCDSARFQAEHKQHPSYRALAQGQDLVPSYSSLWYSVAVYEHARLTPSNTFKVLSLDHHRALAHVREAAERAEWADRAVRDGLSGDSLRDAIRASAKPRDEGGSSRGRPALPRLVKGLNKIDKLLASLPADVAIAELDGAALSEQQAEEVRVAALRMRSYADMIMERLSRLPGGV